VAPLRLRGLRGKQSTPSDWLGGTGVVSTVGEQERHGAGEILPSMTNTVIASMHGNGIVKLMNGLCKMACVSYSGLSKIVDNILDGVKWLLLPFLAFLYSVNRFLHHSRRDSDT
jgi:hypothetical protein